MLKVEIRVKGLIDEHWAEWLGGLELTHIEENETVLSGKLTDQAALYGLLTRLRNLGLELISVNTIPPTEIEESCQA